MDHQNPRDAAAISYFSLFALFPAVLVLLAVLNDLLSLLEAKRVVVNRIVSFFPVPQRFLAQNLAQLGDPSPALVISCVVVVLWTSAWVFSFVEGALNRAWDVPGRRTFWESRIRSFTVVVLGGSILLAAATMTAVVGNAQDRTTDAFKSDPIINGLWSAILLLISFLLAALAFFCVFKIMPDRKVVWQEALSGAVVSTLLWELGSFIFFKLAPYFDYERVYGRMGAIIALLAWVYTSNMFMLFGAHFSAQLHRPVEETRPEVIDPDLHLQEQQDPRRRIRSFPRSQ